MKLSLSLFALLFCSLAQAAPPLPPPNQPTQPDYLYRDTNNYVSPEAMFDFRQLFNLNDFYARRIEFVVVKAHSVSGIGEATMMINNGRGGATQYIDGATRDFFFYPDPNRDEMDIEVQMLKMYLKGNVVLEGIGVKFFGGGGHNPPPPPPPPNYPPLEETVRMDSTMIGNGSIEIARYVDLMRYRGYRLTGVILYASALQVPPVPGDVSFCTARGCSQSVRLSPNTRQVRFNTREFVDRDSRAWRFEFNGAIRTGGFTLLFRR